MRTGLLASSAALAMGAVAMGAGVIPAPAKAPGGLSAFGDPNTNRTPLLPFQPGGSSPDSQGGTTGPAQQPGGLPSVQPPERGEVPPSRGDDRPTVPPAGANPTDPAPSPSAPPSAASPSPSAPSETAPGGGEDIDKAPPGQQKPAEDGKPGKPADTPNQPGGKPSAPSLSEVEKMEAEVIDLVNKERAKAGCEPLKLQSGLAKLARDFSVDMAVRGFFSHLNPDGDTPWDRAEAAGIGNLGGENIAKGQMDAKAVMKAWMSSDGHRANILNCDFKTIGVGVNFGVGGPYWVQNFGL